MYRFFFLLSLFPFDKWEDLRRIKEIKIKERTCISVDIHYLTEKEIDSFLALDKKVYQGDYQVDKQTTMERLKRNPYTDLVVMDGEHMIGYISLCPVDDTIYNQIIQGSISEKEIEQNTLQYNRTGRYKAYLSSIVIDKEKYRWFKGKTLLELLEKHLLQLRKKGIFVTDIVAVAVSIAGKKTLQRFRFKEMVQHANVFYYNARKNEPHFSERNQLFTPLDALFGKMLIINWGSV